MGSKTIKCDNGEVPCFMRHFEVLVALILCVYSVNMEVDMHYKDFGLQVCIDKEVDYLHAINVFLKRVFTDFDELFKKQDASMREVLLFFIGVVGMISTELITSVFVNANLASVRTILHSLQEDALINPMRIGELKKHEDSLVCTVYCLSRKGIRYFITQYPHTEYIEVSGSRRSMLHSYYTSICLVAAYMYGLPCKWEYEDYLSSSIRNGIRVREGLLRADAAILAGKSFCMLEVDTGTESLKTLIDKIYTYYCHHNMLITNDTARKKYMICFAVMKPRVSLADEPRYSPAKLRVMRELIHTPYVEKRFSVFAELEAVRYDRTGLSHRKCMICREVFNDLRDNSPLDLERFRLDEFEEYYSGIVAQSSHVYQEDRARKHDHLCASRIDNLTDSILEDLFCKKLKNTYIAYLLEGAECFFVPALRLHSFLPFIFFNELVSSRINSTIIDRCFSIINRVFGPFEKVEYYYRYWFGDCFLSEFATHDYFCLLNAFVDESDGIKTVICIENLEFDLGARIRVAFAEKFLTPPQDVIVIVICLTRNEESYNEICSKIGISKKKRDGFIIMRLQIGVILKIKG